MEVSSNSRSGDIICRNSHDFLLGGLTNLKVDTICQYFKLCARGMSICRLCYVIFGIFRMQPFIVNSYHLQVSVYSVSIDTFFMMTK